MFSGIDDPQMGAVQTLKGLVHRFGYLRSFAGAPASRFAKTKTGKLNEFDSAGKGLRDIVDKVGRCTPKNEKPSLVSRAVGQYAQHAEKPGHGLNFINDHKTSQRAEHQRWILETVDIKLGFEVKER